MKLALTKALLYYKNKAVSVLESEALPFGEFDLSGDIIEQAFRAIAIISSATDSMCMRSPKVAILPMKRVIISGNPFRIEYGSVDTLATDATVLERVTYYADLLAQQKIVYVPFDVTTDNKPNSWKRAIALPNNYYTGFTPLFVYPDWHESALGY